MKVKDEISEKDKNFEKKENFEQNKKNETIKEQEEIVEKVEKQETLPIKSSNSNNFIPIKNEQKSIFSTFAILLLCLILIIFFIFCGYTIFNALNKNIINGVYIQGLNVSTLSKSDARYQLDNYLKDKLPEEIKVKHGDFESTISVSQIDSAFDTKTATDTAYKIGRTGNIFQNNFSVLSTLFKNVNIKVPVTLNESLLVEFLNNISTQFPDAVIQSSYYIENNELIITSGKQGVVVDVEKSIESIKSALSDFSAQNSPIELSIKPANPDAIDIEKIYNEVHKDPIDASYTKEPFSVHPSENGIDFKISLDEAKQIINSEKKDEYVIPLNIISPNITTNMIGTEAFPDLLSNFSTNYSTSNKNRSTNLMLAANKINGTVLMPGETFSYNKVVGARTISAGYKEAATYVNGQVVDGLGGGICQISTTLYNAAVYANLEILERTNHQFVPSYVPASRDATVSYGSLDFKFKNNRNYPIKLVCSVSRGIANFKIYGLKQEDDVEVQISSYITGRSSTSIYSEAYKILKRNGQIVDKILLSKDIYKQH